MDPPPVEDEWYWDRRNRKAYYPRSVDDETVEFVTVWHREEVADALEGGALIPADDVSFKPPDGFDLFDSFRFDPTPEDDAGESDG